MLHDCFDDLGNYIEISPVLIPHGNGFVQGTIDAFQRDLHLVICPDDIWLTVMVQLGFYVNGPAEELRHLFVAHKDKKDLEIDVSPASVWSVDMAWFAQEVTKLIQVNVVDSELHEWMLPRSLRQHTKEALLVKLNRLSRYGDQATEWSALLVPIVERIIVSFDMPDSQMVEQFWLRACHIAGRRGSGSSITTLSGWLTAFCFFDKDGNRIKDISNERLEYYAAQRQYGDGVSVSDRCRLVMDDIAYPVISPDTVPKAVCDFKAVMKDTAAKIKHITTMYAGCVAMTATESRAEAGVYDTYQPRSGWWMLEDSVEPL